MATRYIVEKLRSDGTPHMGTLNSCVRRYANDRNALRYFAKLLREPQFAPGQYQVSTWPEGGTIPQRVVGTLYKQAETNAPQDGVHGRLHPSGFLFSS